MDRRTFLKGMGTGLGLAAGGLPGLALADADPDANVRDYLYKIRNFDHHFPDDVYVDPARMPLLQSTVARLKRLMRYVGYANFNLIGVDRALYYARNYDAIGAFTRAEIDWLEEIFYTDARRYGFYGEKVVTEFTHAPRYREVVKIPRTGHYLYKGAPHAYYRKIRRDVGESVILTSGIRSVVKQTLLFLDKARRNRGNLSLASRSLAPPGYSFHGIGDFDVGKVGFGKLNFTAKFARTREYQRLIDLGYVRIRYTDANPYGVRYEPWHIKIV